MGMAYWVMMGSGPVVVEFALPIICVCVRGEVWVVLLGGRIVK